MSIYNIYGQRIDNDAAGGGIVDAAKVKAYQQIWFSGADSSAYGTAGMVAPCVSGETFYWDGTFATTGSYTTPRMLSALPNADSIYDTTVTVGDALTANEDGGYTATADGAVFFPLEFNKGATVETRAYGYNIQTAPVDFYYAKNYLENYVVNTPPSPLTLSGIMANFIPMIGKKAAVLGDSLSEQSAGYNSGADSYGFYSGLYDHDGWFSRIARKYGMDYRVHGYCMQWWYVTDDRAAGGVKAVNSLIESGYNPDYVILEYGTNDIWSGSIGASTDTADAAATSTVGAMRYCIETLQAELPSTKILVIMPCMRNGRDTQQATYYDTVIPVLREYGIPHVDMAWESGIVKSMMNSDGVHLRDGDTYSNDTEAVARYSRCIESAMLRM